MPVIKSAIKKLRRDKKQEKENNLFRASVEKAVKEATKSPTQKAAGAAFSLVDKAVKKNLLHKNKAARIKSKISLLLPKKTPKSTTATGVSTPKAATKKTTSKKTTK